MSCCDADGEKALPFTPSESAPGAEVVEHSGRQTNELDDGPLVDDGCVKSDCLRNKRDGGDVASCFGIIKPICFRQKIFNAERLSGEDAIEGNETELALLVNEIRDM